MNRRSLAMVVGIALPTVLLGAGWLAASLREREALRREQEQLLARTAEAVRGAVDESLEELRLREDRRPFYLYNPLYSPPPEEVMALNDPLVASPLSNDPDDVRILGYFQVDPTGGVRTPYAETLSELARTERGQRVVEVVTSSSFDTLRALAYAPESLTNPEQTSPLLAAMTPGPAPRVAPPDGVQATARRAARRPRARSRVRNGPTIPRDESTALEGQANQEATAEDESWSATSSSSSSRSSSRYGIGSSSSRSENAMSPREEVGTGNADLAPQGPLTTNLSAWNREVYDDIQQAQAGNAEANFRVQQRGRAAPSTRRNTIGWQEVADNSQAPIPPQVDLSRDATSPSSRNPIAPQVRAQLGNRRAKQSARTKTSPGTKTDPRQSKAKRQRRPTTRQATPETAQPTDPTPPPSQIEVEVGYTPMAWGIFGDGVVVLHRVVSHEGTGVIQGVILDRDYLVEQWLPALIKRHVVTATMPQVIDRGDAQPLDCAIRLPASELIEDVELCYSAASVAQATALAQDDMSLQVAALAGLVLIVTLAGLAMYRATGRAEELSRQKSAFVSSVSHELRTPLTTIRMHAEMLRDGLVPEAKRGRFHTQLVHEAVRLSHLVENVLELSRLEEGRRVLSPQFGDLRLAVSGVVAEHRPFVEEKGFELHGPEPGESVTIAFDSQAVSQIVINLVDNAVKYGTSADARVDVEVEAEGDVAFIVVRDRGCGIPSDERERVFERFHRIRAPEQEHMPGTGIGLSLVRELAHAHGGDAEVRDAPGGGCEVRVLFPGDARALR